ncbi:MAG: glycolate oxidase subunit GlcF [Alphaproteobacteria bacterium]|nr:glycolate oxidase subunit GlcF [Alphaproteobacteria bacterium]
MRTNFSAGQLADPHLAEAEKQLRACVHCGICTATCPTYTLLGDELDGPRGRIQLIQHMLETDSTPSAKVVSHIDRCLSCLACVSACPSGVNYPRLIDEARAHIERKAARPTARRWLRRALGTVLPDRKKLRLALSLARLGAIAAPVLPKALRIPAETAARFAIHGPAAKTRHHKPETAPAKRVALHVGCVQEVIAPQITASAIRVLTRHGFEVVTVEGTGCCGSLNHHLGQTTEAERHATALVNDIIAEDARRRFDAIVTTASGCATTIRDYGFHITTQDAKHVATRTRDIAEVLKDAPLQPGTAHKGTRVAYHSACSMTHGLKQPGVAPQLLRKLGFDVVEPRDTNCCGSAGVYNVLEPDIAGELQSRKAASLMATEPQLVATGNIGCWAQIKAAVPVPVVHTIELIDWATGGPKPFTS